MSKIGVWLLAFAGPIAMKVLIALGFTAVTLTGVTVLTNQLLVIAQNNWAAMPLASLQMANNLGVTQGIGMIFGAALARLAVWSAVNGTKLVFR